MCAYAKKPVSFSGVSSTVAASTGAATTVTATTVTAPTTATATTAAIATAIATAITAIAAIAATATTTASTVTATAIAAIATTAAGSTLSFPHTSFFPGTGITVAQTLQLPGADSPVYGCTNAPGRIFQVVTGITGKSMPKGSHFLLAITSFECRLQYLAGHFG
jgi:hypothetical protein